MFVIRPAQEGDKKAFFEFSKQSTVGIRNLPHDPEKIDRKIHLSQESFLREVEKPGDEEYTFILEDLKTGQVGGTSGIFANVDPKNDFSFKIVTEKRASHSAVIQEQQVLKLAPPFKNISEVCALFLLPEFRHSGLGRLLSFSRFLFISSHRKRFHNTILAEMRGIIDENQNSPFWENVGRHFCNLSFPELLERISQNTILINDILPSYPLYVSLLPKVAQEAIGQTHEATKPAVELLLHQGFTYTGKIDALEGGPALKAPTSKIRCIRESKVVKVNLVDDAELNQGSFLLANVTLNFRACYGNIKIVKKMGLISRDVGEALQIKNNDFVRYI